MILTHRDELEASTRDFQCNQSNRLPDVALVWMAAGHHFALAVPIWRKPWTRSPYPITSVTFWTP